MYYIMFSKPPEVSWRNHVPRSTMVTYGQLQMGTGWQTAEHHQGQLLRWDVRWQKNQKKKRALLIGEIQIPSVFLQNMSVPQFQLPWMVGYGRYPPFGFQRFHQQEPDSPGRFGYIPQFDGHEKKRKSWWGRQKKKKTGITIVLDP